MLDPNPATAEREVTTDEDRQKLVRDARLLERVADGDPRARHRLVEKLLPRVRRMAIHMSAHAELVDGLTQDVMVQVLQSAPQYRADGCLEAWGDRIAVRTILRRLRRERRRREPVDPIFMGHDGVKSVDDLVEGRMRSLGVARLLSQLPDEQRVALVLKLVLGHSVAETSALMDRGVWSVRYLLRKGLSTLRKLVLEDGDLRELLERRRS